MAVANAQITSGSGLDILTVPAGKNYAITSIILCSTETPDPTGDFDAYFSIHVRVNGAVANDSNKIVSSAELPASDTFTLDSEKMVLSAGDIIRVVNEGAVNPNNNPIPSSPNMTATISWLEV